MSKFPDKPYYTSSEGVKFALQPGVTPIPKPINPPVSRPQSRSFGKPDCQPLLKPSVTKLVSDFTHGSLNQEPHFRPSDVKRISNLTAGHYQPKDSYDQRLRNQARMVSPSPNLPRPRFKVTLKSKQPLANSAVAKNARVPDTAVEWEYMN